MGAQQPIDISETAKQQIKKLNRTITAPREN
jgi:hypothetical protein